jgi:hypothetical protein
VIALWLLVAIRAAGLTVGTDTPEALCPDLAETRTAVRARVGDIEGAGTWDARYTMVRRPQHLTGDAVRLKLTDPAGSVRLERLVPVAGRSCAALAQALALILEAYFQDAADPAGPEAERAAPARDVPAEVARAPEAAVATSGASVPPASRGLQIELGLLAAATSRGDAAGGLSFGVGAQHWRAGLLATATPAERSDMSANERSAELRIPLCWRTGGDGWWIGLGPELALAIDHASGNARSGWRLAPGGGAAAAIIYMMSAVVGVGIDLHADVTPAGWTKRFVLANGSANPPEVLKSPTFRGLAGAGLFFVWGR